MDRLAICRTCHHAFVVRAQAKGKKTLAPKCEQCGASAAVSDGTPAGFFRLFNEAFPTATPRRIKKQMWQLASEVAAGRLTPAEALEGAEMSAEDRRFFLMLAIALAALMSSLFGNYQNERAAEANERSSDETTRLFAEMVQELHRLADIREAVASSKAQRVSQARSQGAGQGQSEPPAKPKLRSNKAKRGR